MACCAQAVDHSLLDWYYVHERLFYVHQSRGGERGGTMRKLSERQRRILDFVARYTSDHGYPPSIREIGQAVGITSTSVVDYNLKALERSGLIRRDREVSRGLGLVGQASAAKPQVIRVPIVGRIAAGEPIEAIESRDDYLELGAGTVPDGCYALRVNGKSMIEDLIDDGDLVVVRPQETADNGDIVVALLMSQGPSTEGVATLKRLYRERDKVRLQPANATMQPIFVDPDQLRVQGKVVSVIRHLY
jgi:repressor LexA